MAAAVDNAVVNLQRANAELQRQLGTAIRHDRCAEGDVSRPFFTTKPPGEDTGLVLSLSYDIVTGQHRSAISVNSEVGVFTKFTIRLPCGPATRPWRAAGHP
jgi:C4-dicarboxylate-specific signal transduction histidine kinase